MHLRYRLLLSLLLFALIVQGYLLYDYTYVWWDSGAYIGMAKHIYSLGQSGLWEDIRPPLFPLFLGVFWKVGLPFLYTARFVTVLFTLAVLLFTYKLGRQLYNWQTGILATALLATSSTFLFTGAQAFSDVPSLFFALLALYFVLHEQPFLGGLCCGLAFLTRFPQGFILATSAAYLAVCTWQHRESLSALFRKGFLLGLGFALPVLLYLITNYAFYGSFSDPVLHAMNVIKTSPPNYLDVKYFYLIHLFMENYLFPASLLGAWTLIRQKRYAVLALLALPCLFYYPYFALKQTREARYLLVFLPYLAFLTAHGLERILAKQRWITAQLLLVSMVLCLLFLRGTLGIYLTDFGPYQVDEYARLTRDYYHFLNETTYVLTTHPAVAAFTDHKILVMYRTPFDEAYGKYFRRSGVTHAFLNECDLQCSDEKCRKDRDDFLNWMTHNHVLLNQTYGKCRYYLVRKA